MIVLRKSTLGLMASMSCIAWAAANEGGGSGASETLSIDAALNKLSIDNDDDWTEAGLPSMARMKELTGNNDLSRSDVGEAKPGFNRSTLKNDAPDLNGPAAEKKAQANDRLEETGKRDAQAAVASVAGNAPAPSPDAPETVNQPDGDQQGKAATTEQQGNAANVEPHREKPAEGSTKALENDADRPADAGAGNIDHTSSTQADVLRSERLGDDFGLDPKDDKPDEIGTDNRGKSYADIDVQAVGLQEKLSDDEAQAASAAALAGDSDEISDYDRGFVNGFSAGKTDAGNQLAAERDPMTAQSDYATRELRNSVDPEQPESVTHVAAIEPTAILEAAGGDAIALCEALVMAAASDKYKRNSALTSFARGYMVSQAEIKEVQRRLDIRNAQREETSNLGTLKA